MVLAEPKTRLPLRPLAAVLAGIERGHGEHYLRRFPVPKPGAQISAQAIRRRFVEDPSILRDTLQYLELMSQEEDETCEAITTQWRGRSGIPLGVLLMRTICSAFERAWRGDETARHWLCAILPGARNRRGGRVSYVLHDDYVEAYRAVRRHCVRVLHEALHLLTATQRGGLFGSVQEARRSLLRAIKSPRVLAHIARTLGKADPRLRDRALLLDIFHDRRARIEVLAVEGIRRRVLRGKHLSVLRKALGEARVNYRNEIRNLEAEITAKKWRPVLSKRLLREALNARRHTRAGLKTLYLARLREELAELSPARPPIRERLPDRRSPPDTVGGDGAL